MPQYDKYGHCSKCHKNMTITQVIDGKEEIRFTPEYCETEYLLDDGSKMRVALCRTCKSNLKDSDSADIMACVVEGWKEEVKGLSDWSYEKKKNYLDRYTRLKIVTKAENKADDVLNRELKEYHFKRAVKRVVGR